MAASGVRRKGERRAVLRQAIVVALAVGLSAAQATRTFTGTIIDDVCGSAGHAPMRMGPTDAECTTACISSHGAAYALLVGKNVYTLSDQRAPEKFAGQKVRIRGTLDSKTGALKVESITAAK